MRNPVYVNIVTASILRLHKEYPNNTIGEHLILALDGEELYNTTDEDLAHYLTAYLIDLDINIQEDD